ncbi:MAG: MFS transporter, partial [Rhodospirillaceae bacterium]|nr:MFS transporter [Rhodospirillaceae bacterium]
WSAHGMLAIFFLGTGASAVAIGFADTPLGLTIGLGAIGLFASIYHPVGTAVVVAHAVNPGRALGLNGVCGSAGIAAAPLIAGLAIAVFGWRWAFILPGLASIVAGLVFLYACRGATGDAGPKQHSRTEYRVDRRDAIRGLGILMITALSIGVMAQAIMVGLPKVFEIRVTSIAWAGLVGISGLATLALCFSMVGQMLGGRLADRFPLKTVYVATYAVLAPAAMFAATLTEMPLVAFAALVMMLTSTGLPAENTLIAQFCPSSWHARVYGVKFVLSLGVAALAVPMVGAIYDATGGFFWLFAVIAGFAVLIVACGIFLPTAQTSLDRKMV